MFFEPTVLLQVSLSSKKTHFSTRYNHNISIIFYPGCSIILVIMKFIYLLGLLLIGFAGISKSAGRAKVVNGKLVINGQVVSTIPTRPPTPLVAPASPCKAGDLWNQCNIVDSQCKYQMHSQINSNNACCQNQHTCTNYPNAKCHCNYCGGEWAIWVVSNEYNEQRVIDCGN